MVEEMLLVEKRGYICTLTLNRPEKRNALSPELLAKLEDSFCNLARDEEVRVVVLRGSGELAFSAGFDVARLEEEAIRRRTYGQGFFDSCLTALLAYPRPVIAMIYGYAVGGGLELAAACDLRLAADNATLGHPAARMGQVESYTLIQMFLRLLGLSRTKELLFTGRTMDAQRAKEIGLVDEVVPARDLPSATYKLASEIAENSPLSITSTKLILSKLLEHERPGPLLAAELDAIVFRGDDSEDAREGPRAFLEKRKPRFVGR